MKHLLFNPISGKGDGRSFAESFNVTVGEKSRLVDMTQIKSYKDFMEILSEDDEVYLFGGDGTLNRFINGVGDIKIKNKVYYYPCGNGNDFAADIGMNEVCEPYLINSYIENLPTVTVNGRTNKFINGVGYGIDGYCCEVGDKMKSEHRFPNYTTIAIKGLLFHFKPTNATVTVDGETHTYEKVWIAPTMYGSHYGGGMIPTPDQNRNSTEPTLSLMIFHGSGKLKTLMIFPSIFKGTHITHKNEVTILRGKEITVKFDRPTPLQIDGETVLNVEEYTASI